METKEIWRTVPSLAEIMVSNRNIEWLRLQHGRQILKRGTFGRRSVASAQKGRMNSVPLDMSIVG